MKCDYCEEESKYTLQNGEHYCGSCIKKESMILTIDTCIDYLSTNENSINVDQHFKLLSVVYERNKKLFKGNKST